MARSFADFLFSDSSSARFRAFRVVRGKLSYARDEAATPIRVRPRLGGGGLYSEQDEAAAEGGARAWLRPGRVCRVARGPHRDSVRRDSALSAFDGGGARRQLRRRHVEWHSARDDARPRAFL